MTTANSHAPLIDHQSVGDTGFVRATLAFATYAFLVCVLLWPTLATMVTTWASSSSYHHGFLVAPLALWMMWRGGVTTVSGSPSLAAVSAVLAAALIWLAGHAANINLLEQVGFVGLIIAGVGAAFGAAQVRRWSFPLLFLFFLVPAGEVLLPPLQQATAISAVSLLKLTGIRASLDGLQITTSSGAFEIAEACAGLNFLLAALMVAAVYSWMAFRSRAKSAAFLIFAIVCALAANVLRAYLVILAATTTGGRYTIGADHVLFGWMFYGLLLIALVLVGRRFADAGTTEPDARPPMLRSRGSVQIVSVVLALGIVSAVAVYARIVVDRTPIVALPAALPLWSAPGWRVSEPFSGWRARLADADRVSHASYQTSQFSLQLALGFFAFERPNAEIVSHASRAFDGEHWRKTGSRTIKVVAFGEWRRIEIEALVNPSGQRLAVATFYWLDDAIFESPRALKFRLACQRLRGRRSRGGVILVAVAGNSARGGDRAIEAFLSSAEPLSGWLARLDAKASN